MPPIKKCIRCWTEKQQSQWIRWMLDGISGTEELEDVYCYLHVVVVFMSGNLLFTTNYFKDYHPVEWEVCVRSSFLCKYCMPLRHMRKHYSMVVQITPNLPLNISQPIKFCSVFTTLDGLDSSCITCAVGRSQYWITLELVSIPGELQFCQIF